MIRTLNNNIRIVNNDRLTERDVLFCANYNDHKCIKKSVQVVQICSDIKRFIYDCFKRNDCNGRDWLR